MKKRYFFYVPAGAIFALLAVYSAAARAGALRGLRLWGEILVPSLLPYFAAAGLLSRLGFLAALSRRIGKPLGKLLRVGDQGVGLFLLGLSGGYPLGALALGEGIRAGTLSREEGEHLLRFCDNTGPAFAVGAVGVGVFHSPLWGALLWGVHALAALLLGLCLRRRAPRPSPAAGNAALPSFSEAFTAAVSASVSSLLDIGGNVVFFSALLGVTGVLGFPERAASSLAALTGGGADACAALLTGALELSSGIGAMAGLPLAPGSLAMASFLLGWGGLCVHLQSAAVTAGTGVSLLPRLACKLAHGALSAAMTYFLASQLL